MFLVLGSTFKLLDVGFDIVCHGADSWGNFPQLLPQGEDQAFAEPDLSFVKSHNVGILELGIDFKSQFFLLFGDLIELIRD